MLLPISALSADNCTLRNSSIINWISSIENTVYCWHNYHDDLRILIDQDSHTATQERSRTIKDLANTPFKRAMLVIQVISYILIVGSPFIGAAIGGLLGLNAKKIGGLILAIFIAGEILFYGSLAFLGKEVVLLIRDKIKRWFKKGDRRKHSEKSN